MISTTSLSSNFKIEQSDYRTIYFSQVFWSCQVLQHSIFSVLRAMVPDTFHLNGNLTMNPTLNTCNFVRHVKVIKLQEPIIVENVRIMSLPTVKSEAFTVYF